MSAPVQAPANDTEPSLAPQLEASLEVLAAIERIEITEGHEWTGACDCGVQLSRCTEVFDGCCSTECCALNLLWVWHPQQDQSKRAVQWCVAMIEMSFARARERAVGGNER